MTLRLAYYADDFTGATDALEQLETAGVRTKLYLKPPSRETLAALPDVEAIGVAGRTRSLPTAEIEAEVRPALRALRDLGPAHLHYKVCSTFDSSPEIGSIGRVIDVAAEEFRGPIIPLVVGAPGLGRWCVFGNLFASYGIGADTPAYRLDRHPSMSRHPVTPADEADLRLHLRRQTNKRVALVDVRVLEQGPQAAIGAARQAADGAAIVLFDCLTSDNVTTIGVVLEHFAGKNQPLFSIGSSAIESALAPLWRRSAEVEDHGTADGPVLVLAGSCSPVTAAQIHEARQAGFVVIGIDPMRILQDAAHAAREASDEAIDAFRTAPGVVISSQTKEQVDGQLPAQKLGEALAAVYRRVREAVTPTLTVVAGGDTSSYVARALPIESLTYSAGLVPGAPVCRAESADPLISAARFVFKGGQVGRPNFFVNLLRQNQGFAT